MEDLIDAAYILIAIPLTLIIKYLFSKISIRARYFWIFITTFLVVLSIILIVFLYRLDVGVEWHRGIQLSLLLSAFYTYQRIEPLPENREVRGSNVNANIEQYKAYLKSRREHKKWWEFWL